jgi:spore maturation protein CgeB
MKILISNSKNPHFLAPQFVQCASQLGYQVNSTFYYDIVNDFLEKGIFNKILFRLFPNLIYKKANRQLLEDVDNHKPDVLWIFKGMEIYPETLTLLKKRGIKLINYNLDHPLYYYSRGSGNKNILNSINLYDLHFTYSLEIKKLLEVEYPNLCVDYLPFGFPTTVKYFDLNKIKENKKVCFVGYGDKERFELIKILSENDIEIDVFGTKWGEMLKKTKLKGVSFFPTVFGNQYWETIVSYRVQLNLLRPHNYLSHNMRTFEVPVVGGIMLTQKTPEHLSFFEINKEAFYFTQSTSLISEIKKILAFSDAEALEIRRNAAEKSQKSGYSYLNRTKFALERISELL